MIKLCLNGRYLRRIEVKRLASRFNHLRPFSSSNDINEFVQKYLDKPISATPSPDEYERIWSQFWEANNINATKFTDSPGSYSLLFPPPNITGNLHLGHAMTLAIQDAYIRHQKMYTNANVAFLPGFDHAGIATYLILDKMHRAAKGVGLKDLDKAEFEAFFEQWKEERIKRIKDQLVRLGASLDFNHQYFTLDPDLANAVNNAFSHLFHKGLIYRSNSIVYWSYYFQSTLSDMEVKSQHLPGPTKLTVPGYPEPVDFGLFHTITYPLIDCEPGEGIKVSTMNIFTIPGDVAIAVNPLDERYTKYHNKLVFNPITEKPIPIIVDEQADMNLGTGAVKITPASSPTDYQIALKHQLPIKNFMNPDGTLVDDACSPRFTRLKECKHRYDLKKEILKLLQDMNLYDGYTGKATQVPICKRSGDVIEHRIMPQWFLDVKPGYDLLRSRIESNHLEIYPAKKVNLLLEWFEKKKDWCISRQIPFGHPIPAWRAVSHDKETWFVAGTEKRAIKKALQHFQAKNIVLEREKDVLDTWFSSALLPLSAVGWPNSHSPMFKTFYPFTLMETGFDILNFWVMRMCLLSLYLTRTLPFPEVHLHGMVTDGRGKKMSKSEGNVIDPLDVIDGIELPALQAQTKKAFDDGLLSHEEYKNAIVTQELLFPKGISPCGADGLRLSLYEYNSKSESIKLGVAHLENNRHLVNKIWQAFRFYLHCLKELPEDFSKINCEEDLKTWEHKLTSIDKWILSRFYHFIKDFRQNIENFAPQHIYREFVMFWINCFCDTYIEAIKPRKDFPANPFSVACCGQIISSTMVAMHPLTPFLTEELYQRMKRQRNLQDRELKSISLERFPSERLFSRFANKSLDEQVRALRFIRHTMAYFRNTANLSKDQLSNIPIQIYSQEVTDHSLFEVLRRIGYTKNFTIIHEEEAKDSLSSISLHATHNSFILVPANMKLCTAVLDSLEKTIPRLQANIMRSLNSTERFSSAEHLERTLIDRDHVIRVMEHLNNQGANH